MHLYRMGVVATSVVTIVALGACGGKTEQPSVASAATESVRATPSASAGGGVVEQYVAAVRKYVECVRAEGVNLPDPGPKGQIDYSSVLGGSNKRDPKLMAAQEKCKDLLPPVPDGVEDKGQALTAEQIRYVREYAKCMRANGVPEFPDPLPDGRWPESGTQNMTEQEKAANVRAQRICEPVLSGKPPTTSDSDESPQG